ncbi:chemotaxis protein CheW [Scytonema sp. UIC 10036]|uniref:chemotaxis protein CheW n=1 Tax=Scytonema sp. UIC 10036 TaxID=2304196 RepID=UPI0012DADF81|nr:chemotaxis protein CheW [Scytonema sp. UIC 10036]MUG92705.1 chemotaxis protein CheW [Scytonema sp. UIC 10036]
MLFLLLNIDNQLYAIASQQVVEVLSLVILKTLPHTPKYVAGVFNYRGSVVPVLDLCQLMHDRPCCEHFSTRIVLINHCGCDRNETSKSEMPHLVGLIAERVVETLQTSETEMVDPNIEVDAAPYLGKIILNAQRMIQCIRPEYLTVTGNQ